MRHYALAMHADIRMTERYTLAAIDPSLVAVVAQVGQRLPAVPVGRPSGGPSDRSSGK
jgi:hypothetical protein